ncbi:MAG: 50S ribosomal protein L11 methyltransferase [Archangium sp.]|nr:50S ribosomal protein L11 methyltransferase [Archangium sp.]
MHPLEAELRVLAPFLCPELRLWLLPPASKSWHATEPSLLGMPYWAFAWPGGQVLARYVLDHPEVVRGKRVLDFGSGCAIEGVAAAKCGGAVRCADLDPLAGELALRNAVLNEVLLEVTTEDLIGTTPDVDVILAGDVCYSFQLAARLMPWLTAQAARGVRVLLGDPGRVPGALDSAEKVATWDASFDGDPRGLTCWPTHVFSL